VKCFWTFLSALAGAVALAVEHLGKGFMLACLVAAAGGGPCARALAPFLSASLGEARKESIMKND
jgi:hypothetical protein